MINQIMKIKDRKQLRVLLLAYHYDKMYDNKLNDNDFYAKIPINERNNAEVFLLDERLIKGSILSTGTANLVTVYRIKSLGMKTIEDIAESRYNIDNPINTKTHPPSKKDYLDLFYSKCVKPNTASICNAAMKAATQIIVNL